jgi:hypothetical protein
MPKKAPSDRWLLIICVIGISASGIAVFYVAHSFLD